MKRSDQELREYSSHVAYEIMMFLASRHRVGEFLQRRSQGHAPSRTDVTDMNAYVESHLLHARALIEFFRCKRAKEDAANEYVAGWTLNKRIDERLAEIKREIDRRLAHLTPARSSDFDWSNRDPLQALRPLVEDFLKRVSDERFDRRPCVNETLLLL